MTPRVLLLQDLRIQLFGAVFAVGTLFHELEFILEQAAVGPLGQYMERWGRVVPSLPLPSAIGLALHGAVMLIALVVLVLPRRREWLCALAVLFLASLLASPARIPSHAGPMATALLVVLVLAVGERLRPRDGDGWYRFTLAGLSWTCALTYGFAFLFKLNPVWFSGRSAGPRFLLAPLALDEGAPLAGTLGWLAIHATLVLELALPVLLFWRRGRPYAVLLGLLFHLPMLARGVSDFPVLTLALYPAFMTGAEARALVARCLARPSAGRLVTTLIATGAGGWAIARSPKLLEMHGHLSGALYRTAWLANGLLTVVAFAACVHAFLALAGWRAPGGGEAAISRKEVPAALVAGLVCALFLYVNAAVFLRLPSAGAMVMYSGADLERDNHLLFRRRGKGDSVGYATVLALETEAPAGDLRAFLRALGPGTEVNLNFLRYHLSRVCASGQKVRLALRWRDGERRWYPDACAAPEMVRYWPFPIATPCSPNCRALLTRWAQGRLVD
jgi:hypothetical protein